MAVSFNGELASPLPSSPMESRATGRRGDVVNLYPGSLYPRYPYFSSAELIGILGNIVNEIKREYPGIPIFCLLTGNIFEYHPGQSKDGQLCSNAFQDEKPKGN
jgi:hypothetical protein